MGAALSPIVTTTTTTSTTLTSATTTTTARFFAFWKHYLGPESTTRSSRRSSPPRRSTAGGRPGQFHCLAFFSSVPFEAEKWADSVHLPKAPVRCSLRSPSCVFCSAAGLRRCPKPCSRQCRGFSTMAWSRRLHRSPAFCPCALCFVRQDVDMPGFVASDQDRIANSCCDLASGPVACTGCNANMI